jgi:hypothetical protein
MAFAFVKEPILLKLRFQLGISARSFPQVTIISPNGILFPYKKDDFGYLKPRSLEIFIKKYIYRQLEPINLLRFN